MPGSAPVDTPDQAGYVRQIFNDMADEYDHLYDLWYRYQFDAIDRVLVTSCRPAAPATGAGKPIALDVGCGTGIQSLRLAQLGYRVNGLDIADKLVEQARAKLTSAGYDDGTFVVGDAQQLPFADGFADLVTCCGSTVSLIPDWKRALAEIARCLKPGGRFLLDVEGRWTLDLGWDVVNALLFNALGYDHTLREAVRSFMPPWSAGPIFDYPFKLESGESVRMPIKLFTASELGRELAAVGLAEDCRWGIHAITNLIPSTVLHDAHPNRVVKAVFSALAAIERPINGRWPVNTFANSLLALATKQPG